MKIQNVSGRTREIAATGQFVQPDEVVEVDEKLGKSLCQQPAKWALVREPKKSKKSKEDDR